MTDAFIIKSMTEDKRRLVYRAFLEFGKTGEKTSEFMARMCLERCAILIAEKEAVEMQAARLDDDDKSEKDCMWERD